MRLWHYSIIPYLPNSQLVAQWRELNSIFKNQPKHILINYVYDYPKEDLFLYALMVIEEMKKRSISITSFDNAVQYFYGAKNCRVQAFPLILEYVGDKTAPFANDHDGFYLKVCYYNLAEKFRCGQKDFTNEAFAKLKDYVKSKVGRA